MECKDFKNDLVSLVFGEIDNERKQKLEQHLKKCSACRKELEELKSTSGVLSEWKDEEPEIKYVFTKRESFFSRVWSAFYDLAWPKKSAITVFSAAVILFVFLSAAHTTISVHNGTWQISVGAKTPENPDKSEELARFMNSYHKELITLVAQMIQESESKQQKITNYKLIQLADHFNKARQTDLLVLGNELIDIQKTTQGQIEKTNQVLNNLIQLTSYQYKK